MIGSVSDPYGIRIKGSTAFTHARSPHYNTLVHLPIARLETAIYLFTFGQNNSNRLINLGNANNIFKMYFHVNFILIACVSASNKLKITLPDYLCHVRHLDVLI